MNTDIARTATIFVVYFNSSNFNNYTPALKKCVCVGGGGGGGGLYWFTSVRHSVRPSVIRPSVIP